MAILRFSAVIVVFALIVNFSNAYAAKAKDGELVDSDFTYKGIALSDSEEKVLKKLGKPVFTRNRSVYGVAVRYLEYKNDVTIGIMERNNTVADITIGDKKYKARKNIRYGATTHYIEKIYGHKEREMLDGEIIYKYEKPNAKYEYLILTLDSENHSLKRIRITRLPLTEEAADIMGEDPLLSNDLFVILAGEEDIDTSALKKQKPVKVEGLEK